MHVACQPLAFHGGAPVAAERLDLGLGGGEFGEQSCPLFAVLDDAGHPQPERDGEGEAEAGDRSRDRQSRQHGIAAVEDPREQGEACEDARARTTDPAMARRLSAASTQVSG